MEKLFIQQGKKDVTYLFQPRLKYNEAKIS